MSPLPVVEHLDVLDGLGHDLLSGAITAEGVDRHAKMTHFRG